MIDLSSLKEIGQLTIAVVEEVITLAAQRSTPASLSSPCSSRSGSCKRHARHVSARAARGSCLPGRRLAVARYLSFMRAIYNLSANNITFSLRNYLHNSINLFL